MQEIIPNLCTWLIGICLFVTIIYWITSSAVESSKLAREVRDLKQMMQQILNDQQNPVNDPVNNPLNNSMIKEFVYCTECSTKLSSKEHTCASCKQY
ncbi:hypothetical protein [Paenibacillus sp. FSL W7-1287]|uniref:hypothetical protein n=1 Tax=Paenibacillus sp. FSL W7-1287 TaxID=2954538 RepID=UPI0030FC9183